jgi:peptide/nickel transport system permease protein
VTRIFQTGSIQLTLGVIIGIFLVIVGISGSLFLTPEHLDSHLMERLKPPGTKGHLLGTDQLGRDLLYRTLSAFPWSAGIGATSTIILTTIGTFFGLTGAWSRGWVRNAVLMSTSLVIAFPALVMAVVMIAIIGRGFWPIALTLGIIAWPPVSRVVYAEALSLMKREYVLAAQLMGVSKWRILLTHILPGIRPTIVVMMAFMFAVMLIIESALSFLGLGAPLNAPSWGNMLADSRQYLVNAPWMMFVPAGTIVLSVICLNLIGDGLSEISRRRARAIEV